MNQQQFRNLYRRLAAPAGEPGDKSSVDVDALAKVLGVTADPGSDPAGFVKEMLAKLDEVRAELTGEGAPSTEPAPNEDAPAAARRSMKLTQREIDYCNDRGVDLEKYKRVKAELAAKTTYAGARR